jgi:hypothetical protein
MQKKDAPFTAVIETTAFFERAIQVAAAPAMSSAKKTYALTARFRLFPRKILIFPAEGIRLLCKTVGRAGGIRPFSLPGAPSPELHFSTRRTK